MQTVISGPYDLAAQSAFFGGWTHEAGGGIVMAFPVEGWTHSAAVTVRQRGDKIEGQVIEGQVNGGQVNGGQVNGGAGAAWEQALAALSLDADGAGYPAVGERDPVLGKLQHQHGFIRPVLFHSPYEAACAFVIGHRLRIAQTRAIRARLAREHGESFAVAGTTVHAFPAPQRLLELTDGLGIPAEKVTRLHGVARAALDGRLDRARLRAAPVEESLVAVRELRGVGAFFATGIVLRGAGLVDAWPGDDMTRAGIERHYGPGADVAAITEVWRPYRMWCSVLIHGLERGERGA